VFVGVLVLWDVEDGIGVLGKLVDNELSATSPVKNAFISTVSVLS